MNLDVLKFLFQATASENDLFPGLLRKPFVIGKWVYASDGALAVRAPAADVERLGLDVWDHPHGGQRRAEHFPWRLTRQTRADWPALPSIAHREHAGEPPVPYVVAFGKKFDPGYVVGLSLAGAVPCEPVSLERAEWPYEEPMQPPIGLVGPGFEALLMRVNTESDLACESAGREFYRRIVALINGAGIQEAA